MMNSKFTYGDAILVKQNAPQHLRPGAFGSICSVTQITTEQEEELFPCQKGEWVYTVEYEDGTDERIGECYLKKDLGIIRGSEITGHSNYFIDGYVSSIKMYMHHVEIQMNTSLIKDASVDVVLRLHEGYCSGKIIATQIDSIVINNNSRSFGWQQKGKISAFEVSDNILKLLIEWERAKTTSFEIKSGQIWWEQRNCVNSGDQPDKY